MSDAEALGNELRQARENRNLTLLQIEREIKIRAKFLEAFEQGNYTTLPSVVHARGFLRNYARFLGLDGDLAVSRYDAALLGNRRRGRRSPPPAHLEVPPPIVRNPSTLTATQEMRAVNVPARQNGTAPTPIPQAEPVAPRRRSILIIILGISFFLLILAGGAFLGFQWLQHRLTQNDQSVILTAIPATVTVIPSATPTPTTERPTPLPIPEGTQVTTIDNGTLTPLSTAPGTGLNITVTAINPSASGSGATALPGTKSPAVSNLVPTANSAILTGQVNITLNIVARSWLSVWADDQIKFVGVPAPNTVLKYSGNKIRIRAANASGIRAIINNQDYGLLGARGEIFDQTFTVGGTIKGVPAATATSNANSQNDDGVRAVDLRLSNPDGIEGPIAASGTPTRTPTTTRTPNPALPARSATSLSASSTPMYLPNVTSTPLSGETRPH